MKPDAVEEWARRWVQDWNNHDLDAVLAHYADDVVFTSPVAARVLPASGGELHGIDQLRIYWSSGLPRRPSLHFVLTDVLTTVQGGTVLYTDEIGQIAAETMLFDEAGKVTRAVAAYRKARTD